MRVLLACFLLAGCQTSLPVAQKAAPKASATPAPRASTTPLALLQRPSGTVTELAGSVGMDATYVVSAGRGQILSNNAGNVLALGGAIVSNNGGGAVPEGNAIAARHLLADPAQGLLPTSGALVRVTSLVTGQPLTLGVDAAGKPVTAIYTNAQGAFKAYIPASEAGNVLVQVTAPGESDERLRYDLVADPRAAAAVDDDTDLVTRFVRTVFAARMVTILAEPGATALDTVLASADNTQNAAVKEVLRGIVQELNAAARQAGVPLSPGSPKVQELAGRLIDVIMASLGPLDQVMITKLMAPDWPGAELPALPAMGGAMKDLREATAAKLAGDPAFFKTHGFDFKDGQDQPFTGKIDVFKAADPGAYLVREFLSKNERNGFRNCDYVFKDLGVQDGQDHIRHSWRLEAATYALLGAITLALTPDGAAHGPVLQALTDYARAQGWQP